MNDVFFISFVSTVLFAVAKFVEMKFIDKEWKPLKFIVRDAIIVFAVSFAASSVYFHFHVSLADFMNIITDVKSPAVTADVAKHAEIFTDTPNF